RSAGGAAAPGAWLRSGAARRSSRCRRRGRRSWHPSVPCNSLAKEIISPTTHVCRLARPSADRARWCAMGKTDDSPDQLRKGAKVVAREALRDVPEGTAGKVIMVSGITWIRYWVRFDNGISLGSIDRNVLATADEWKRHER